VTCRWPRTATDIGRCSAYRRPMCWSGWSWQHHEDCVKHRVNAWCTLWTKTTGQGLPVSLCSRCIDTFVVALSWSAICYLPNTAVERLIVYFVCNTVDQRFYYIEYLLWLLGVLVSEGW